MILLLVDTCAIVSALICIFGLRVWRKRSLSRLPPGPKGLPVIRNLLDIQDPELWETARKWGERYGPLVHAEALGTSFVYVNTYDAAVDLFDKRGHIYSSRPKNTMLELEGWNWAITMKPYGDDLRRGRQLMHRFFQPTALDNCFELQTQSVHGMLDRLLDEPDKYPELLQRASGEILMMMTYGYKAREGNDPYIELAERSVLAVAEAQEPFLVNLFPFLQYLPSWFPGARFKKIAEEGYQVSLSMYREPYDMAKRLMSEGSAAPSIVSKIYEAYVAGDAVVKDEDVVRQVVGTIYGAGSTTVVSVLNSFFLTMLLHPEVQQRAQNEIDQVVGKDCLPSFNDRPNLPYLDAVIKETFRWQPIAPFGIAHTADDDDEYNGYFIPAGTTILPNVWAMLRDPKEYPEPEKFIPERWLPAEGKEPPLDVYKMFFGFGRRICPGRYFADNAVFIGAASILAAFNITKALDENGVPITPKAKYTPRFIRQPEPFPYVLTPRSEKIINVIRHAAESAK